MSATSPSVVVLFGGSSNERLVSVASAQNVLRVLPEARPVFLAPDGAVFEVSAEELAAHQDPFQRAFQPRGPSTAASLDALLGQGALRAAAVLLALHGGEGEDGRLQAKLAAAKVAFTGSDSAASSLAFDKAQAKGAVQRAGGRTAVGVELAPSTDVAALEGRLGALLAEHPRWVLKPVADGSSFGLVHLTGAAKVGEAARTVAALHTRYLAEQFVVGRELTVGVADFAEGTRALPVSEVRFAPHAAFDYEGKYLGKGTEELTPAPLEPSEAAAAQALGVLAHRATGCAGYSRTDMMLTAAGPVFLEINTLPGLTRASFIPQQLAAAGLDFRAFLEWQLELGRRRAASSPA